MIRTLLILVFFLLATIFWSNLLIVASFISRNDNISHRIAKLWAKTLLVAGGIEVVTKGLSNIDPGRPYIFMPNHMSNVDIPVLQAYLPVQFRWVAKAELFRIPLFGFVLQRSGYISIDRSDHKSAIQSLKEAELKLKKGTSILIFPEGTRSRDHKIKAFKKGGFILALDSGIPIVPVVIHGTGKIMPKNRLRIHPSLVTLEIAAPVDTKAYDRHTKNDLMEKVRHVMCKAFEKETGVRPSC